jgi:hypothetical protein
LAAPKATRVPGSLLRPPGFAGRAGFKNSKNEKSETRRPRIEGSERSPS